MTIGRGSRSRLVQFRTVILVAAEGSDSIDSNAASVSLWQGGNRLATATPNHNIVLFENVDGFIGKGRSKSFTITVDAAHDLHGQTFGLEVAQVDFFTLDGYPLEDINYEGTEDPTLHYVHERTADVGILVDGNTIVHEGRLAIYRMTVYNEGPDPVDIVSSSFHYEGMRFIPEFSTVGLYQYDENYQSVEWDVWGLEVGESVTAELQFVVDLETAGSDLYVYAYEYTNAIDENWYNGFDDMSTYVAFNLDQVENANPAANGTSVSTGYDNVGQWRFTAPDDPALIEAQLYYFTFEVNASNVVLDAGGFRVYNKAASSVWAPAYVIDADGIFHADGPVTGLLTVIANIDGTAVDMSMGAGDDVTVVLGMDVLNPLVGTRGSSLQATLIGDQTAWLGLYAEDAVSDWLDMRVGRKESTRYSS